VLHGSALFCDTVCLFPLLAVRYPFVGTARTMLHGDTMAASNAEVEAESTVSDSSGITRVPKSVRQELGIDRGDVLQFVVTSSGDVVLTKKEQ